MYWAVIVGLNVKLGNIAKITEVTVSFWVGHVHKNEHKLVQQKNVGLPMAKEQKQGKLKNSLN